ncbi:FdhF/YdeP family oxidoreductase [Candidatus Uabimicrobium amorphum]|uniref:Formate dehydrogenase n=1 Tax=Uabimicrobium amorphum TaxID=2596890 RepID=A0A5S9IJ63_UABAM|nr:FdhF/YdeP family oxidoreductase [Candidatus Uabimicrobium amorphum]BBM82828.1 formate dehydrogenase [Candidatus Uabimicrobium amorphum]
MNYKRKNTQAQPPLENFSDAKITKNPDVAGGSKAVMSSTQHAFKEMGTLRTLQTLRKVNQKDGFDCPGCAWPDPEDKRSVVEFCENGVKAVAEEATKKRVTPQFFGEWSVDKLSLQSDYWLGKQGRLTHPVYLAPDASCYEEISWEDALEKITTKLKDLESANDAVFYTSGRTSNEAAFLLQLFARMLGTNNLPDCSNMCHESSGMGLKQVIGIGKGTVTLEDFEHAECIVVLGQNPGTNHPRMLTALQKAARGGCQIITINPLSEVGSNRFAHPQEVSGLMGVNSTKLTSLFLQVKINGDVALLKGILKAWLALDEQNDKRLIDYDFIEKNTVGFDAFCTDIREESWEIIVEESGISQEKIEEATQIIAHAKSMICCWAMGLTQHKNAIANIQNVVNLLLLGGHFGRKGAGACPVRGHSNVQGDRTVGITSNPPQALLENLSKVFDFTPPQQKGYDTVAAIEAMYDSKVKVFFSMGGNFLSATPDTEYTATAMSNCDLTVHVSTKLNRAHLITGKESIILPCLGRTEQDVQNGKLQFCSVENSMGIVHKTQGLLTPASTELRSEIWIVREMAKAMFPEKFAWDSMDNYDVVRECIEKTIAGFDNYNKRVHDGFYLPNAVRDKCYFATSSEKGVFTSHPIPRSTLQKDEYMMMTIRSHDQYNTTIYGLSDRYRGIHNTRRVILMNRSDMENAQLKQGDHVDITSHFSGEKRIARKFMVVEYDIPACCVATYFPEANVLVPIGHKADGSNTPASKSIVVTLVKFNADRD